MEQSYTTANMDANAALELINKNYTDPLMNVIVTFAICANIIAFTGLSHTQHVVLDPLCPPGYWDISISLLFIRFAVYCLVAFSMCCSREIRGARCFMSVTVLALLTIFSVAVSDSVVTDQAIKALNCSTALRAGKDSHPLLIVSGSMFVAFDWFLCLCVCCTCRSKCIERATIMDPDVENGTLQSVDPQSFWS